MTNKRIEPYFSVVIPVYNKGPHIHRSISSVLKQTDQNFELILVNDASTDNSLEEIQKFTDDRIRLFQRTEPGSGGYAARNLGIEKAKGEWVAFLDADDEWYPNHLEKMYALAQKYPDVYFMGCGWQKKKEKIIFENGFFKEFKFHSSLIINVELYLKYSLKRRRPVWTSVACIKKSSPVAINLFPSELGAKRGGDLHAWLEMICYHKKMAWSNHMGAIYHIDSINMVTKRAEASPQLMSRKVFDSLSYYLTDKENILLKKYFNRSLKILWLGALRRNQEKINIRKMLFWKGDFYEAMRIYMLSFLPIKSLLKLKRSFY